MTYLKNRKSPRARWWDYRSAGAYFITICTKDRQHYFGQVHDGVMRLSDTGCIADRLWYQIIDHFPMVQLDAFVVMPNHIHGIIIIQNMVGAGRIGAGLLGTGHALSVRTVSLSTIVGSYKSAVTKRCNELQLPNGWQTRFHDRIIRDEGEFGRIATYIENNPRNWKEDGFY